METNQPETSGKVAYLKKLGEKIENAWNNGDTVSVKAFIEEMEKDVRYIKAFIEKMEKDVRYIKEEIKRQLYSNLGKV